MSDNKQKSVGYGLEFLVLLAVDNLRGEGYGLTIQEELNQLAGKEVNAGSLYNTLERLEDKGLIKPQWEQNPTPGRGGKRRLFYEITGEGQKAIREVWEQQEQAKRRWERLGGLRPAPNSFLSGDGLLFTASGNH